MIIEGGQIKGALFNFFVVKNALFCIFWMLPSVSTITPGGKNIFNPLLAGVYLKVKKKWTQGT